MDFCKDCVKIVVIKKTTTDVIIYYKSYLSSHTDNDRERQGKGRALPNLASHTDFPA